MTYAKLRTPRLTDTDAIRIRSGLHRWENGDTCIRCGLHREGAGAGPYGAMRYYRDDQKGYDYKPGSCPGESTMNQLDTIRNALWSGQISAAKVDAQRVFIEVARRDWAVRVLDAWAAQLDTYWFTVDDDITTYVRYPRCPGLGLGSGIGNDAARLSAADAVFPGLPGDVAATIGSRP